MKYFPFSLALIASLASFHPSPLMAQDDNQTKNDKKDAKEHHQKADKSVTQGGKAAQVAPSTASHQKVRSQGNGTQFQATHVQSVNSRSITQQNVQGGNHQSNSSQIRGQVEFTPQGNRSNHYGGRWVEGGQHADWGNSGEHQWHHHNYRWYDGGWLIIDTGYQTGGSIGSAVQQKLSEQGYYHGPIDGDIGPGSSRAIANYQSDNGLTVTGTINDALVGSLGLQ